MSSGQFEREKAISCLLLIHKAVYFTTKKQMRFLITKARQYFGFPFRVCHRKYLHGEADVKLIVLIYIHNQSIIYNQSFK